MRLTFPIPPEALPSFSFPNHPSTNMTQTMLGYQYAQFASLGPPSKVSQSDSSGQSTPSSDKKPPATRIGDFVIRHGQRLHAFDSEKAPYPLSYERSVLEMSVLLYFSFDFASFSALQGIIREQVRSVFEKLCIFHDFQPTTTEGPRPRLWST